MVPGTTTTLQRVLRRKCARRLLIGSLRPRTSRREGRVVDGPFAEAKELVGGYWTIQARSAEEVLEWAKRCPGVDCRVELRPIVELDDLPPAIQEVYDLDLHIGVEAPSAPEAEAG